MKPDRKRAAAISAVAAYISAEEAAFAITEAEVETFPQAEAPLGDRSAAAMSIWSLSGRQQQMQMRNLMQMKALQRGTGWQR